MVYKRDVQTFITGSLSYAAAPLPMQVWHQIRKVNVSTLSTTLQVRLARRPRFLFAGGSISTACLGTHLSRPHKFRARQGLIIFSPVSDLFCSDMSVRRLYATNETNGKQPLANGTEDSLTGRPHETHHDAELRVNHTHNNETPHSRSHSIFGHSHSNGVEAHTHDTEQIIAALEGKGLGSYH